MACPRGFLSTAAITLVLLGSSSKPAYLHEAQSPTATVGVRPVLHLEKPRYVLGEAIRFWVGVSPKNSSLVAEEFRSPCHLTIVRPDGSTAVQSVGWPMDGIVGAGWTGGWGFGEEKVQVGSYSLSLECSGEKTPPVSLVVERNDIADQVKAEFRFERTGAVKMGIPLPILFTVENNSRNTIRFPQRGSGDAAISVEVDREEPLSRSIFFYPSAKLGGASTDGPLTYGWDTASPRPPAGPPAIEVPSVVLKPGEHFVQHLSLNDAYPFEEPGNHQITLATVLAVLVD
jgi:hypothetical protein